MRLRPEWISISTIDWLRPSWPTTRALSAAMKPSSSSMPFISSRMVVDATSPLTLAM